MYYFKDLLISPMISLIGMIELALRDLINAIGIKNLKDYYFISWCDYIYFSDNIL
jgi:hypothetical protein